MTCFTIGTLFRTSLAVAVCFTVACEGTDLDDGSTSTSTTTSSTDDSTTVDPSTSVGPTTEPTGPTASATTSDTTEGDTTAGPDCGLPPVEEEIVGQLFIYGASQSYVAIDSSTALSLAWIDFGFPAQVDACVEWSIDPVDDVSIDESGLLTVGPSVPAETVISVTADLENGRRLITTDLTVYEPLQSPILGYWSEVLQLPCDGSPGFVPDPIIPELIFYDTGEFTVTWTPFEVYIDYWGTFTHDEGTGALSLTVTGGNYVPDDVDGEGTATVAAGQLTLEDIWLGTAQEPVTPPACGHVFE